MSVLGTALDVASSGWLSGVTALISGGIGAYTKIQELKIINEHRKFEMKYEVKMHQMQFQSDKFMAEKALLITKQVGEDMAFKAAIEAEGRLSDVDLPWPVRAIRTLFRPFLTIFMWAGTIYLAMADLPVNAITQGVAITFQQGAGIGTGFWFGSRAVGSNPNR